VRSFFERQGKLRFVESVGQMFDRLRERDLIPNVKHRSMITWIQKHSLASIVLGVPPAETTIRQNTSAVEQACFVFAREIRFLRSHRKRHDKRRTDGYNHAGIHDLIFSRAFGQMDFMPARAVHFESRFGKRPT